MELLAVNYEATRATMNKDFWMQCYRPVVCFVFFAALLLKLCDFIMMAIILFM